MGIKIVRSTVGLPQNSSVHYNQLRTAPPSRKVCNYWLEGRCNRNPCRFLHDERAAQLTSIERHDLSTDKKPQKPQENVCQYWISGNCVKGDKCPFLHSWFHGIDFAMLAKLEGHKKGLSGIALPCGFTKLYSGSKDGTIRIWDCHTGQCDQVINLGGEVGCFTCEGPWLFVGLPNIVKAWNIENGARYDISGPVGQVHAMEVAKNMLFAGVLVIYF